MNKVIKVKITKATFPTMWYVNEIGEEYEVELQHKDSYNITEDIAKLRNGNYNISIRSILKQDCTILN